MALFQVNKKFIKIQWDKNAVSFYILLLLNSFLYTLIFDEPRLALLEYSSNQQSLLIIMFALFNLFLFFILMLSKWVFVIINPLLYYIGAVGVIYANNFHLPVNIYTAPKFLLHNTINSSISTNINFNIFITAMFLIGLILGLVRFFFAQDNSVMRKGQAFALIFVIALISYTFLSKNYSNITMQPFAFFKGVNTYALESVSYHINSGKRQDIVEKDNYKDDIYGIVIFIDKLNKDIFSNKDNMSLLKQYDFTVFSNVKSKFANNYNTRSAIMTASSAENVSNILNKKSFLSYFKESGYPVEYIGIYNNLIAKDHLNYHIIKNDTENFNELYTCRSPNLFRSLSFLDSFLQKNTGGLFVINAEGSSPIIKDRYKEFITLPDNKNDYENYTDYIDAFLYEVINKLNNKKAFIILRGLEGESITNNKVSFDDKTSMIIWVSNNLDKKYHMTDNIKNNKNDKIFDDTIFNTLQGCFQLKELNNGRNLCRIVTK